MQIFAGCAHFRVKAIHFTARHKTCEDKIQLMVRTCVILAGERVQYERGNMNRDNVSETENGSAKYRGDHDK